MRGGTMRGWSMWCRDGPSGVETCGGGETCGVEPSGVETCGVETHGVNTIGLETGGVKYHPTTKTTDANMLVHRHGTH